MRGLSMLLLIAALAGSPARALEAPKPGPTDPRIKVVDYDPWQIVKLSGVFRTATQILFGQDETIQHAALGDTSGWEIAADANMLFVKPSAARPPTNLLVTTSGPAGPRHYTFELTARGGPTSRSTPNTIFVLRFRYPADERQQAAAAISARQARLEAKIIQLKLDRAVLEGPRNLAYTAQGASDLQPSEVSDNGVFTVMRFPAHQPLPAIYQVGPGRTEALAAFDVRGEFVVLHAVVSELRLRRGRLVLCLYNEAFDRYGRRTDSGSAAPDVQRTDRGGPDHE